MQLFSELVEKWNDVFYNSFDPRIRDKFLMGSPLLSLFLCLIYVIVFQFLFPKWMKKREKFSVAKLLALINVFNCFGSAYFFYKASTLFGWLQGESWRCAPIDRSMDERALEQVEVCWQFCMFNYLFAIESIVNALAKIKTIGSGFYVAHHALLPLATTILFSYLPGGHFTFFMFANSGAHIIVYGYYSLQIIFPQLKMKKKMRIIGCLALHTIQGVLVSLHDYQLFLWNDCQYPTFYIYPFVLVVTILAYYRFKDFFKYKLSISWPGNNQDLQIIFFSIHFDSHLFK